MRSQVRLPDPIAAVFITEQLADRQTAAPNFLREKLAIQNLAEVMSDHPDEVLPRLAKLGMEICGAHSAGISIFEPEVGQFRWVRARGRTGDLRRRDDSAEFQPLRGLPRSGPSPSSWNIQNVPTTGSETRESRCPRCCSSH